MSLTLILLLAIIYVGIRVIVGGFEKVLKAAGKKFWRWLNK